MAKIQLKNPIAQKLLEQKEVIISGIPIKLWTGHNKDNISAHNKWDKIISYTELNKKTTGTSGTIVFSGTMQIPRHEATIYATHLGFKVHSNISRNTDFLVIGSENVSPSKIAKIIELEKENKIIEIIDEITFLELVLSNIDTTVIDSYKTSTKDTLRKTRKKTKTKKENPQNIEIISDILKGAKIVISGTFKKHSRNELKKLIEQYGGKNQSSVSKNTDYFLAGEKVGPSKLEKVKKFGIKTVNEDEFINMLNL